MPKISVIMPAYNAEKYIAEAMDSILGQTFGDFEFIILNDCSKDRTEEVILSYTDPRIVYVKNEENMGVARTLNKGLELAKGEYIARMDADDISLPERFAKQVTYLDTNRQYAAVGSNAIIFYEDGTQHYTDVPTDLQSIKLALPISNPFIHPVMMLRKNMLENIRYDSTFEGREDYRFWMCLFQKHKMSNLPDRLLRYRHHLNQVTQKQDPSKEEKHFYLKKCYYNELFADLSKDMTEALCTAAYHGYVTSKEQAFSLKEGLCLLAAHLNGGILPAHYENLAISCAKRTGMNKKELWLFTKNMSLKTKLHSLL